MYQERAQRCHRPARVDADRGAPGAPRPRPDGAGPLLLLVVRQDQPMARQVQPGRECIVASKRWIIIFQILLARIHWSVSFCQLLRRMFESGLVDIYRRRTLRRMKHLEEIHHEQGTSLKFQMGVGHLRLITVAVFFMGRGASLKATEAGSRFNTIYI